MEETPAGEHEEEQPGEPRGEFLSVPMEVESAEGEDFNATASEDAAEVNETDGELSDGMSEDELRRAQAAIDDAEPEGHESAHEADPAER